MGAFRWAAGAYVGLPRAPPVATAMALEDLRQCYPLQRAKGGLTVCEQHTAAAATDAQEAEALEAIGREQTRPNQQACHQAVRFGDRPG